MSLEQVDTCPTCPAPRRPRSGLATLVALASLSASAVGCAHTPPPLQSKSFVLVHGAWMGAWSWSQVAARLRLDGAEVRVVELPGHGEDTTPVGDISLEGYVNEVTEAIDASTQSHPVHLVGHSLGGVVITQTAEARASRIAGLIYVAAYVPRDGESLQSLAQRDAGSQLPPLLKVDGATRTGALPRDRVADLFCADCSAELKSEIQTRYRDEPIVPTGTPVRTTDAGWGATRKFYVYTEDDRVLSYGLQRALTDGLSLVQTKTLTAGHSPFLSAPAETADALSSFARE